MSIPLWLWQFTLTWHLNHFNFYIVAYFVVSFFQWINSFLFQLANGKCFYLISSASAKEFETYSEHESVENVEEKYVAVAPLQYWKSQYASPWQKYLFQVSNASNKNLSPNYHTQLIRTVAQDKENWINTESKMHGQKLKNNFWSCVSVILILLKKKTGQP